VLRSGRRVRGESTGVAGESGGRSCCVLDEDGRCDVRRPFDLGSVAGIRLTVTGVVTLAGAGEGAEGSDWRWFTRVTRDCAVSGCTAGTAE
jgi:hypothetical protein